mgnify:CR=1 FL=1
MAFCFKGIVLVVVAMVAQPVKGKSIQPPWRIFSVNKARELEETKRNTSSNFTFLPISDIAKGLDYLKKKYPDVDWSAVTPTSGTGRREFKNENLLKQAKRTSSFVFLNQSDIAKGLDYLKKKYPDVDWSAVTPTSGTGRRELKSEIMDSNTNGILNEVAEELKKSFQIHDSSIQQRNDISDQHDDGQGVLEEKSPDESAALIEEQLHAEY